MDNINSRVFSVTEVNRYLKNKIESDVLMNDFWLEGEISNFKAHSSGHLYFTIKDNNSSLDCVMFAGNTYALKFIPKNGSKIISFGKISMYEKNGRIQLYVDFMHEKGIGILHEEFERLKKKLSSEGLFDEKHKRQINENPKIIAVITSETGAAFQDIIKVLKRRNNHIEIFIIPTLVQGIDAADNVIKSIDIANKWRKADTIIIGRGGGSLEDLSVFNNEEVVRAIFNSKTPIITGIGHETDFTLSDFVSDLRAATPSMAAELAIVFDMSYKKEKLTNYNNILKYFINNKIKDYKDRIYNIEKYNFFELLNSNINDNKLYILDLYKLLNKKINDTLYSKAKEIKYKSEVLESLSPINIINRGFSIVLKNEKVVHSTKQLKIADNINIRIGNGNVDAKVININNNNEVI